MMRERQKFLLDIEHQDEEAMVSTDLALIWASVTNVVPSAVTVALHMFTDPELLAEVRECVSEATPFNLTLDIKVHQKLPLLQTLHAETLRFGVQIHIPRTASHHNINIAGARIPKDEWILVNTYLAHNEADIWNTKDGKYSLDRLWGKRFLIDMHDPSSGPQRQIAFCTCRDSDR